MFFLEILFLMLLYLADLNNQEIQYLLKDFCVLSYDLNWSV